MRRVRELACSIVLNVLLALLISSLDSPPKQRRLAKQALRNFAVVVPHLAHDRGKLLSLLDRWRQYPPCLPGDQRQIMVVFYSASKLREAAQMEVEAKFKTLLECHCLQAQPIFKHANLNIDDNSYLRGSRLMFEHLLNTRLDLPLDRVLVMETDVYPVKLGWLSRMADLAGSDPAGWMWGSVYRGKTPLQDPSALHRWHLNGNAIYHLNGLAEAYQLYYEANDLVGYDVHLGAMLWQDLARYAHRFAATNLIENHWHSSWSREDLNPLCQLVHGGYPIEYPGD